LRNISSQSSARFVTLEYTPGRTAHYHPLSEEVIYVVAGRGHIWLDGERLPVTVGDVIHVPTGLAHATVPDQGTAMELMCFFPHPSLADNLVNTDLVVAPVGDQPVAGTPSPTTEPREEDHV
jgi:quercetin dioxygenase-like cupin family protein